MTRAWRILCASGGHPETLRPFADDPYVRDGREEAGKLLQQRQQITEVLAILRSRTRKDYNGYKRPTVVRRIERRMGLNQILSLAEYVKFLRQIPWKSRASPMTC